jgi:quinol monooxygenase YgiN
MGGVPQDEVNMCRTVCASVVIAAVSVALPALRAQEGSAGTAVYAVAYVDVSASEQAAAVSALKAYRQAIGREAGHLRSDVLDQIGRPGHFVLVESWRDQVAFDAHTGGAAWMQFQQAIEKVRASGYDQRPYKPLNVGTAAAPTAAGRPIHVVSHVDIGGGGAGLAGAPAMLGQLAEASRKERGNLRFDVLQHAMRANHFTVVESWADQAALDAHAAAAHTRRYREALQPISGSPLDERTYLAVE